MRTKIVFCITALSLPSASFVARGPLTIPRMCNSAQLYDRRGTGDVRRVPKHAQKQSD